MYFPQCDHDFKSQPLNNYLASTGRIPSAQPSGSANMANNLLYEWIALSCKGPIEGLELGSFFRLSDYGVPGLALLSADTFFDAVKFFIAYLPLFDEDIVGAQIERPSALESCLTTKHAVHADWSDKAKSFHVFSICSAIYNLISNLIGSRDWVTAISLPVDSPDIGVLERYFDAPIRLRGAVIKFYFNVALLDKQIETANKAVFMVASKLTSELYLKRFEKEEGGLRQHISEILESMPNRFPDIRIIANRLNMSERTLRRRLTEENCSYREIVDQARESRAKFLLANSELTAEQIGELLGYRDSSSFRHAFRRWSGQTAISYRQQYRVGNCAFQIDNVAVMA